MYGHPITPPKPRLKSKTYWVNGIAVVLLGLEVNFKMLQPFLPVNVFLIASFVLPFVNFILREFTNRGVGALPRSRAGFTINGVEPYDPPSPVRPNVGQDNNG